MLDDVPDAVVEVTALTPAQTTPHIELLGYQGDYNQRVPAPTGTGSADSRRRAGRSVEKRDRARRTSRRSPPGRRRDRQARPRRLRRRSDRVRNDRNGHKRSIVEFDEQQSCSKLTGFLARLERWCSDLRRLRPALRSGPVWRFAQAGAEVVRRMASCANVRGSHDKSKKPNVGWVPLNLPGPKRLS
jgi:hypothetical protein